MTGQPIRLSFRPHLYSQGGKLLSGKVGRGRAVYAASFVRDRCIILESDLLNDAEAFLLILIHELFHFVWPRLANSARRTFSELLVDEWNSGARGELGESADVCKSWLRPNDCRDQSRRWREYCCESFCDTAAWLYTTSRDQAIFSLAERYRKRRAAWFEAAIREETPC